MKTRFLVISLFLFLLAVALLALVILPSMAGKAAPNLVPLNQWLDTHQDPTQLKSAYYYYTVGVANCAGVVQQVSCGGNAGSYWANYKIYLGQTCQQFTLPPLPNVWNQYALVYLYSSYNTFAGDDFAPRIQLVLPCLSQVTDNNGHKYNLLPYFIPYAAKVAPTPYP